MNFYQKTAEECFAELKSSGSGLGSEEAQKRLEKFGKNTIEAEYRINALKIFLQQFANTLVIILVAAAIVLVVLGFAENNLGNFIEAALILAIVAINGVFGFVQDYKAEKSMKELKKLSAPTTIVCRQGELLEVKSELLVPGDAIVLEEGSIVPADCRVVEEAGLEVDESALTGESRPVPKHAQKISAERVLAERKNLAYLGTLVVSGRGKAIVYATGQKTEVGKIAKLTMQEKETKSRFEIELDKLGKKIGLGILVIVAIVFLTNLLLQTTGIVQIFIIAVALAVAAIPEGLPAVMTLSLAYGTKKMLKKNTLVRRLSVIESLGSVDVICSDKTGTITEGKMKARKVFLNGKTCPVENHFHESRESELLLYACALSNNTKIVDGKRAGDYTETALAEFASHAGYEKEGLEKTIPRIEEIGFSHERKMMSTLHKFEGKKIVFAKGAAQALLQKCSNYLENGKEKKLGEKTRKKVLAAESGMARDALRVICFAFKQKKAVAKEGMEKDLVLLGLVGLSDPPRKTIKEAIKACKSAGINVKMITGDKAITALAIAREIGLKGECVEGSALEKMSEQELLEKVETTTIFSRVDPGHKLRILKALQKKNHVVAMTGDGVNDAPALKGADVGIAMGLHGTNVAKEASDLILLDDQFSTIVEAIREGRTSFNNIRKFVNYLLTTNFAEVFVVFIASLMGFLPLTAVHLLLINMFTDGIPALALGLDPAPKGIMEQKPKPKNEGVINKKLALMIAAIGTKMTVIILVMISLLISYGDTVVQTTAFVMFVLFELNRINAIKREEGTSILANKWLVLAMMSSITATLLLVYLPINQLFGLAPLGALEWLLILAGLGIAWLLTPVIIKAVNKAVPGPQQG